MTHPTEALREQIQNNLIANACALHHVTGGAVAAIEIPVPGTERVIVIGTRADLRGLLADAHLASKSQAEPVAEVDEGDDGLFIDFLYGPNGSPLKRGDKLYLAPQGREAQAERPPEGWREVTQGMRDASYTITQYSETADVVFDSVMDALEELEAEAKASSPVAQSATASQEGETGSAWTSTCAAATSAWLMKVRDDVLEEAAERLDLMNDSSGDAAAYDQREQNIYELEREHAISDCAAAIRALKLPAVEDKAVGQDGEAAKGAAGQEGAA